jgi:hypothetical protein
MITRSKVANKSIIWINIYKHPYPIAIEIDINRTKTVYDLIQLLMIQKIIPSRTSIDNIHVS